MAKQEIQISSVKLINGGLKGLEIKYLEINDVNSNLYKSEITKKNRRPVNIDMQLKFEDFKDYLAELCSVDVEKVSITGITAAHNKFLISGTVEVLDKKKSAINTPCITEDDGYDKFDIVQEKVDGMYKMVLEYMEKEAYTATNMQMILQYNEGKEGFDPEAVKNMTEAEQIAEATKLLEKTGCVVLNPNEEDMPGGIDSEEDDEFVGDISGGDEKMEMFVNGTPTIKKEDLVSPEDFNIPSNIDKVKSEMVFENTPITKNGIKEMELDGRKITVIDQNVASKEDIETAIKKQKAQDQLAKLKESQKKVEQISDEDDAFIPMRRVV